MGELQIQKESETLKTARNPRAFFILRIRESLSLNRKEALYARVSIMRVQWNRRKEEKNYIAS